LFPYTTLFRSQAPEHGLDGLVPQNRDAEDVVVRGQALEQPGNRLGRVRAVPDVLAAALQPARERDLDLGPDRAAEEGLRRLAGAAEPDLVLRHEVSPF